MSKKQMYTWRVDDLCTDRCEVLFLCPRTVHVESNDPLPLEELERIRELNAKAVIQSWQSPPLKPTRKLRRI